MRHEIKTTMELELTVIAHVSPAVPPRPCSDPDHPNYSDPGDPGEKQVEAVFITNLKTEQRIDITDCLTPEDLEYLADEAYEDAELGE